MALHSNPDGVSWCQAHERYEPAADYIDFECSPTFLGAYHEMGLTPRYSFAAPENRPSWQEPSYVEPAQQDVANFQSVWTSIQRMQEQIREIKNMLADDTGTGRRRGREQREIQL
jgi:hypothetical protein